MRSDLSEEDLQIKLFEEIIDYVESNKQYSYYELKAFMIENKPEWEPAFNDKKTRAMLSMYLKAARKEKHIRVGSMIDSIQVLQKAEERQRNKNNKQ